MLPEFQYLVPDTLQEACAMLGQIGSQAMVLSGGTDLLVKMRAGLLKPSCLVSLKKLEELRGITRRPGVGIVVGARTTQNELAASPLLREKYPSICSAAATMAGYQIRNVGTLGGNLVNAVPSADLPPILIALQAQVRIAGSASQRVVALENFFLGSGKTVLQPGEILVEVVIPDQPTSGSNYIKFGLRRAEALAVVGVATSVAMGDGTATDVRIALGAVAPTPIRARQAEDVLRGQKPGPALIERAGKLAAAASRPISDIRGSADYRRHLVEVLTCDSLSRAIAEGHT